MSVYIARCIPHKTNIGAIQISQRKLFSTLIVTAEFPAQRASNGIFFIWCHHHGLHMVNGDDTRFLLLLEFIWDYGMAEYIRGPIY